MPGDVIQLGAVVGNGSVDLATQRRGLDTAVLGTYLNTDSTGQTWLTGVKVRVASLPDLPRLFGMNQRQPRAADGAMMSNHCGCVDRHRTPGARLCGGCAGNSQQKRGQASPADRNAKRVSHRRESVSRRRQSREYAGCLM